ncbi:MAG: enoyl-CoA hydratase-related protein [Burkholderiales bacterium]|jgi:enoyl-CoA hydratase/carnithine racemase|nr:enoyl-CoA hydratase-related protein [Burkholderiales bacterium]
MPPTSALTSATAPFAYQTLLTEQVGEHVLVVTLNRPQVRNALNTQMWHELLDLWTRLGAEPGEVRCVVLTGAGEQAFCAGGDLKERDGMTAAVWRHQHALIEREYRAMLDFPLPVLAAVNGHAFAGGFEIMLACDFAYAVPGARFALTEVTLGIMPGAGGTQLLPRAVGERRAREILLTGKPFSAAQAFEWGALNALCEPAELLPRVLEVAQTIAGNAPLSVRQAKKSVRFGMQMELQTALRFEAEAYDHLVDTDDRLEGVRAFNEKRKPRFLGR